MIKNGIAVFVFFHDIAAICFATLPLLFCCCIAANVFAANVFAALPLATSNVFLAALPHMSRYTFG